MTLLQFIEQIKLEIGIEFDTNKAIKYCTDEAGKLSNRQTIGVDDETVKKWVIEYANKPQEKPVVKEEKKNEQNTQLSLF